MARKEGKDLVIVAGIGEKNIFFSHIFAPPGGDGEKWDYSEQGVRYYAAPRIKGCKQFDELQEVLLAAVSRPGETELPEGFRAGADIVPHLTRHPDYLSTQRKRGEEVLWEGYIHRAIRRNNEQTAKVVGPCRWRGQHVGAVATGLCSDGKKQKFAMIEAQTGMSIIRAEGLAEARRVGKKIESYLEAHEDLRSLLKESGFGKSPATFPSGDVREQFRGLRAAAEEGRAQ
ncbi:MAG: hypothetical protein GY772_23355 [bacterium]|nr:hypothetical protein [bacterium]